MAIKNKAMAAVACGLSLAMALGGPLSITPAYGATVKIEQDKAGATLTNRTFNAYKLATYKVDATSKKNVYAFVNDDVRTAVKAALTDLGVDLNGVTTDASLAGKVAGLKADDHAKFAAKVATALDGKLTPTAINGTSATLDDNAYYVVTETTADASVVKALPFLLETGTGEQKVTLKSSQPDIDKVITSAGKLDSKYDDANIGSEVSFQLNNMKVPSTYGYDTYTYTITDQMSNGLTLSKAQLDGMKVKIGNAEVKPGADTYKVMVTTPAGEVDASTLDSKWSAQGVKFQIVFNPKYFIGTNGANGYTQTPAPGTAIAVDFSATLNKDAKVASPEENKTQLTYSNTPTTTTNSTEHKVYVYTFGVEVQKTFTDNANLFGKVEFGITGPNGTIYVIENAAGDYTVCKSTDTGAKDASSGLKLDSNGHFQIKGLDEGTYTVKETEIPDGYTSGGDQTIVISPDFGANGANGKAGATIVLPNDTDSDGFVEGAMVNKPNTAQLPTTGEVGMILLPAAGLGIMGAVFVASSKKKSDEANK